MNRREMFQAVAVAVVAGAVPKEQGERVELFGPSLYRVEVKCEWSIAKNAWLIAAFCYDPPVISTGIVQKGKLANGEYSATIEAVKKACHQKVVDELDWIVHQPRNSPFASQITPLWYNFGLTSRGQSDEPT